MFEKSEKPDPKQDQNDLLIALIDKLTERAPSAGLSPEQLEAILTKVGTNSAEAMRSSLKPENPDHSHISAFFTEADRAKYGSWENKPKLRRKTYYNGYEEDYERLTCEEIEAYNAITENREARGGKWKAQIRNLGHPNEELYVTIPCETVDQRMEMPPSTVLFLKELNGGPNTADVTSLIRQIEELQGQLAMAKGLGTATALQREFV